jgi:hypothetical protein
MVHFRRKIKGSLRGTIAGVCLLLVMACGAESEVGKSDRQGSGASIEGFVREQGTDVAIAGAAVFVVSPSDRNQMHATTD